MHWLSLGCLLPSFPLTLVGISILYYSKFSISLFSFVDSLPKDLKNLIETDYSSEELYFSLVGHRSSENLFFDKSILLPSLFATTSMRRIAEYLCGRGRRNMLGQCDSERERSRLSRE